MMEVFAIFGIMAIIGAFTYALISAHGFVCRCIALGDCFDHLHKRFLIMGDNHYQLLSDVNVGKENSAIALSAISARLDRVEEYLTTKGNK